MDNYEIQITHYSSYFDIDVLCMKHKLLNFSMGICDGLKLYPSNADGNPVNVTTEDELKEYMQQRDWVVEIRKDMNQSILLRKYNADACYFSITVESNGIQLLTCELKYKRNEIYKMMQAIVK